MYYYAKARRNGKTVATMFDDKPAVNRADMERFKADEILVEPATTEQILDEVESGTLTRAEVAQDAKYTLFALLDHLEGIGAADDKVTDAILDAINAISDNAQRNYMTWKKEEGRC